MNAYEIARAEATRVVEAAYHKAVAAGELPEGSMFIQDLIGLPVLCEGKTQASCLRAPFLRLR